MTKIISLKAKTNDEMTLMINAYFARNAGLDAKILAIIHDGKTFVTFINAEINERDTAAEAIKVVK